MTRTNANNSKNIKKHKYGQHTTEQLLPKTLNFLLLSTNKGTTENIIVRLQQKGSTVMLDQHINIL